MHSLSLSSATSDAAPSASTSSDVAGRKRKFPSMKDFAEAGGEKMKRKIAPIKHWTELKELELFRVKKVIGMNVVIKKEKRVSFYAELEDKEDNMINVWLTDIIKQGLDKYSVEGGFIYITPLGPAQSKESGYTYHNFAIQEIKDDDF